MVKRIFIIALIISLLSSCAVNSPTEPEPSPLPSPGGPLPSIFIEGELYFFLHPAKGSTRENSAQLNTDDLAYIGDVVGIRDGYDEELGRFLVPEEEFYSSGHFPVGTKIYRVDEETLYIEFEIPYTGITYDIYFSDIGCISSTKSRYYTVEPSDTPNVSPPVPSIDATDTVEAPDPSGYPWAAIPSIFVEGELYIFLHSAKGSTREKAAQLNTNDLEYIGDVVGISYEIDETGYYILAPAEEFHSSGFAVGTKIYRINEDLLYIEGEMPYTGRTYDIFWSDIGYTEEEKYLEWKRSMEETVESSPDADDGVTP